MMIPAESKNYIGKVEKCLEEMRRDMESHSRTPLGQTWSDWLPDTIHRVVEQTIDRYPDPECELRTIGDAICQGQYELTGTSGVPLSSSFCPGRLSRPCRDSTRTEQSPNRS